jgi:hypothetical protein
MPTTEPRPYRLLDDEGRASFLSHFLGAHRAFRRDAGRFPVALRRSAMQTRPGEGPDIDALRGHWDSYEAALAYHHHLEDDWLFPLLAGIDPALRGVIDQLVVQHHDLDETIATVDEALGRLPAVEAVEPAARACDALAEALGPHFDLEEEHLAPVMRSTAIEPDAGDAAEQDGAEDEGAHPDDSGHAFVMPWVADGLDDETVTALVDTLPPSARVTFPRWQADYTDRLRRWWW